MLTRLAGWHRVAASLTAMFACGVLTSTIAPPVARAADGREMLASAIDATKGSYLVYNFGPGHPTSLLDASGRWAGI